MCNGAQYAHRWLLNLHSAIQIITQIIHSIILNIKIELNCARTKRRKIDDRHRIHPPAVWNQCVTRVVGTEKICQRIYTQRWWFIIVAVSQTCYSDRLVVADDDEQQSKMVNGFLCTNCLCVWRSRTTPNERRQINLKWRKKHNVNVFHSNAKSKWKTE